MTLGAPQTKGLSICHLELGVFGAHLWVRGHGKGAGPGPGTCCVTLVGAAFSAPGVLPQMWGCLYHLSSQVPRGPNS